MKEGIHGSRGGVRVIAERGYDVRVEEGIGNHYQLEGRTAKAMIDFGKVRGERVVPATKDAGPLHGGIVTRGVIWKLKV